MVEPIVVVENLTKSFNAGLRGTAGRGRFTAVDDISFTIPQRGSLAIVGESGSGKSTIARMVVGLETPTAGRILVNGRDRSTAARGAAERRRRGREAQMVFQDPYSSLDPRQSIADAIGEVLDLHAGLSGSGRADRIALLLEQVGLGEPYDEAIPSKLSGGQRQRAVIARTLAADPNVLVLDEAVSALDVSTQAQVINLLARLREETGITYIFISHDLAVVRQITDQAIVLRRGKVVEQGETARILEEPHHPYTKILLDSIPRPGWKPRRRLAEIESCGADTA